PPPVAPWPTMPADARPDLLSGARSVLLVAAHPDDETIGAGRLVAGCALPVRAVTLTAGERCVEHQACSPEELASRRLVEWTEALDALGVEPVVTRRWPDGGLGDAVGSAAQLLARLAGRDTAILAPWRRDPHPDHAAAGQAAAAAAVTQGARLIEYVVWAPYWMRLSQVRASGYAVRGVATSDAASAAWRRAIQCYRSQFEPLRPGWPPVVPRTLLGRHRVQLVVERAAHA
ncbi:MAG: PIG-L deacetylase family protein, partial [Dermatophilaceae bacterium]